MFAVAGIAKLADRAGSRESIIAFGLPASWAAPLGLALPLVELGIAAALVPTPSGAWAAAGALGLLLLFIGAIGVNLMKGRRPICHCFGALDSEPIGRRTLVRNLVLAILAGLIIVGSWVAADGPGPDGLELWAANIQVAYVAAIVLVLGAVVMIQAWLLYGLHRRLTTLEARLSTLGITLASTSAPAAMGLAVGTRAPAFRLASLDGGFATLDSLRSRGKPVVLVFTDPACVPCSHLLPSVGRWQREYAGELTVVNVSRGPLEANRANSIKFGVKPVLMQQAGEVNHAYQAQMAPSAVLVRPDGAIDSQLAIGEGAIGALIESAVAASGTRSLSKPSPGAIAAGPATSDPSRV